MQKWTAHVQLRITNTGAKALQHLRKAMMKIDLTIALLTLRAAEPERPGSPY